MDNVEDFLAQLERQPWYDGQIVHTEWLPPRDPVFGSLHQPLPPALQAALARRGVPQLYQHQADALNLARAGRHVVVATGTASGKTLCYNLPVVERILADGRNRALYLFPTKALAQDQTRSLLALLADVGAEGVVQVGTYDGDTPAARRGDLRRQAHVLLTNPDMLHVGMLPNHRLWAHFFANLRYVVIDEAHIYRGVFGSHVANVLRRLLRVCDLYGTLPTLIAASATIANPGEHLRRLTGQRVEVITTDGAPRGPKSFVLWNPPYLGHEEHSAPLARRSANSEAADLMVMLVREQTRALIFTRARRVAELILLYARRALEASRPELARRIAAYRAGYLPEQRRELERRLFNGDLLAVTATNALELGIDVGSLDATVIVGFPGTIASTWQQAGRAGRATQPSLAMLVGQDNPLDQYFMRHPEMLFARPMEQALIHPENPYILGEHLVCAAFEQPLTESDELFFGETMGEHLTALEGQGVLEWREDQWAYRATDYPAEHVSIRAINRDLYLLRDSSAGGTLLETIEGSTAFQRVHPGAVYLHQGDSYLIESLDLKGKVAWARPAHVGFYTQPREMTEVRVGRRWMVRAVGGTAAHLGEVTVRSQVVSFKKHRQFSDEVLEEVPLDLPVETFETVGLWWSVPGRVGQRLAAEGLDFAGGLHALEHTAIGLLPLFAMCDRWDIGGVSTVMHPDTGSALICLYDGHPGGVGIAERGYELLESLWEAVHQALLDCPCEAGCPACVQSPKCGSNNQPLDKQAALLIVEWLLRAEGEQEVEFN